jgi:hypothetical protein
MLILESWINRHWPWFSIAVLAFAGGWIWLSRPLPDSVNAGIPAPQQGFFAPDFTLSTWDGKPMGLADLKGQVVLVNFWVLPIFMDGNSNAVPQAYQEMD